MSSPAAYRTNADGSVTVTGFAHPVRIGAAEVRNEQFFAGPGPWAGPEPVRCVNCAAEAAFLTRSEPRGPELVFLHYHCAACGTTEIEPLD